MLTGPPAVAGEVPLRDVVEALVKASSSAPADFSGQDLSGLADLDQTVLRDARGLDTICGLDQARNRVRAIR